jgi:hypothetical protein
MKKKMEKPGYFFSPVYRAFPEGSHCYCVTKIHDFLGIAIFSCSGSNGTAEPLEFYEREGQGKFFP